MSRASLLIVIGVLAILAPFSGLPVSARSLIAVVLGAAVIGIGIAERSREQHRLVAVQSSSALPAPHTAEPEPAAEPEAHEPPASPFISSF